ncbi:glycosyltransferase family 4 protein [Roseovarius sp. D22-M7]|uniref:glycosyltransferase family 4 protein n=1 Tax=Roseovarius sp. D22-M7 TaxID=3127116 RepID=UPI00300FFAF1
MSPMRSMVFGVSGDIDTVTGGYLYDRRLGKALSAAGHDLRYLRFGDSFPHPEPADMTDALAQLQALPGDCPALVDGLAYGALDTSGLARVRAALVALVHHPLALEPGLDADTADRMAAREAANLGLARHIVVTSPHIAGLLKEHYDVAAHRISVARPGFTPPAPACTPRGTPPLILSVGLQARRKGHDILLRALSRLTDLDWQAEIVGRAHEPDTARALLELRDTLHLGARVTIAGEVDQAVLDGLYRRASLFALATRYEGYGIVFGEAMGHGLPIVATRVGAVPGTVPAKAGHLVPPDDPDALARAIRRLLTDTALREQVAAGARSASADLPNWTDTARVVADAMFAHASVRAS